MLWPTVTLVSWFAMAGLVVALGRGSTSRYECEQNRVQQVAATSTCPAAADRPSDEWDAGLAALAGGPAPSARPVNGDPRAAGTVLIRQAPDERAWYAELGAHLERLPEDWDDLLTDDDALATLVVEVGAALVEAGLPLHDGSVGAADGRGPVGGVCLTPDTGSGGVLVAWRQHERMDLLGVRGPAAADAVRRTMNVAVADVLTHLGLQVEPIGPWGCFRVRPFAPD